MLGISVRSIDYYIINRVLPARRIGSRVLIPHNELVKFAGRDHYEPVALSGQKLGGQHKQSPGYKLGLLA